MKLSDYNYQLEDKYIANCPAAKRDQSKLMCLDRITGHIVHKAFYEIVDSFKDGDVLVRNVSKVFPARLLGQKDTGAKIEFLLLNPRGDDLWEVICKPAKRLKPGSNVFFGKQLKAKVIDSLDDGHRLVKFEYSGDFFELLEQDGNVPLPPYIDYEKGQMDKVSVRDRYQTVYASDNGSCAAPTAGLHFTDEIFEKLKVKGVDVCDVTLHVGPGTFAPLKGDDLSEHVMHKEQYHVDAETIRKLKKAKMEGRRIICVGTTSVRVLESIADKVLQCEPEDLSGSTDIFIYPPYEFKLVDGLVTNFHLPKSTLLMLVSSLATRDIIMNAYEEAKKLNYRFFSFGDAMVIL